MMLTSGTAKTLTISFLLSLVVSVCFVFLLWCRLEEQESRRWREGEVLRLKIEVSPNDTRQVELLLPDLTRLASDSHVMQSRGASGEREAKTENVGQVDFPRINTEREASQPSAPIKPQSTEQSHGVEPRDIKLFDEDEFAAAKQSDPADFEVVKQPGQQSQMVPSQQVVFRPIDADRVASRNIGNDVEMVIAEPKVDRKGKQRLPDCLIIGARKAGTYPLMRFLEQHPSVVSTSPINSFFCAEERYARGVDWYLSQMPYVEDSQVVIEKTAEYFSNPKVPARVHAMNSSIKLMVVLRDPVQRLISDYYSLRRFAMENPGVSWTFQEMHQPVEELVYDKVHKHLNFSYGGLYRSKYIKFLTTWLDMFPRQQFHVIDGDALIAKNPAVELRLVEKFLGLSSYFKEEDFHLNPGKGYWCHLSIGCFGVEKGHHHQPLDPEVETAVRQYLAPFNNDLYKLVGFDFGWK